MMIEIRSYVGVGPLRFGMSPSEASDHLGQPPTVTTNRLSESVHRYPTIFLTFDGEGLAEVSILPEGNPRVRSLDPLTLGGLVALAAEDGAAQEVVGCVVLLNLGIAVTGVHDEEPGQLSVTAFRRGRWERVREQMKPIALLAS
jgi:hypothetical protein